MEQTTLQSTVEAIYRVNADEQARDAIFAREDFLRVQRTQQSQSRRKDEKIAEQENIIAKQADTIIKQEQALAENNAKIEFLLAEIAALKKLINKKEL